MDDMMGKCKEWCVVDIGRLTALRPRGWHERRLCLCESGRLDVQNLLVGRASFPVVRKKRRACQT